MGTDHRSQIQKLDKAKHNRAFKPAIIARQGNFCLKHEPKDEEDLPI
jgi:hypothetical protein